MVDRPTTWGSKQAIVPLKIFKIMFSCWVQQQVTFYSPKDSSWLQPVASLWGGFGGLMPSQKSCKPPKLKYEIVNTINDEDFLFSQCQAPLRKRNSPLLKTIWQQFSMRPCCWVISTLFVWLQKMTSTQQYISNWNVWFSCTHMPRILCVIKNKKILKKFQQLQQ